MTETSEKYSRIRLAFEVLTLFIACIALWKSCAANKQLVEPRINTYLKWENIDNTGNLNPDLWNPIFKIYNDGPVKVVSMDVMYYSYIYNLDNSSYMGSMVQGVTKGKFKYLFEKEFDVFAEIKKGASNLSMDYLPKHVIAVNIFDLRYYRDSDMKEYRRKDLFFIDNGVIYTHREYMNNSRYYEVVSFLDRVYLEHNQSIEYAIKHLQNY